MPIKYLCKSMKEVLAKTSDLNFVSLGRRGCEAETHQEDELNVVL